MTTIHVDDKTFSSQVLDPSGADRMPEDTNTTAFSAGRIPQADRIRRHWIGGVLMLLTIMLVGASLIVAVKKPRCRLSQIDGKALHRFSHFE